MTMHDIYQTLLKRGLTHSQRDFSTYYANKSPSYLATMGCPSEGAMVAVIRRLFQEGHWLLGLRASYDLLVSNKAAA